MAVARELVVESKLIVLVKEGGNLCISEQGWKAKHEVLVGLNTTKWFVKVLEECLRGGKKEVYSVIRESYQSFVDQRCGNSRGRYLSIAEYDQAGRKVLLCFPEGEDGWGWRRL